MANVTANHPGMTWHPLLHHNSIQTAHEIYNFVAARISDLEREAGGRRPEDAGSLGPGGRESGGRRSGSTVHCVVLEMG
jgi:hypothetical protein